MTRKLFFLLAFAFILSNVFALTLKANIYNPNNYDLQDYQFRIDLSNYLSQATYLKVFDANGNVLPFCYEQANGECNTTPSKVIWVKVNLTANTNTTIYIQTSDTNYAVNGDNVFDFYDDFNDGIYTDRWTVAESSGATITEANGYLEISGGTSGETVLLPVTTYSFTDFIVEARVWMDSSIASEPSIAFRVQDSDNLYLLQIYQNPSSPVAAGTFWIQSAGVYTRIGGTYSYPYDGAWHLAKLVVVGSTFTAYFDGTQIDQVTDTTFVDGTIGLRTLYGRLGRWGWIRVRKYADQEPTIKIDYINIAIIKPGNATYYISQVNVTYYVKGSNVGLVSYWKMDEGQGSVVSDSADGNDGTVYNMYSLEFDGVDDYVNSTTPIPYIGLDNHPYAFSVWVKVAPGETDGNIIHMSSRYTGSGWCLPPIALDSGYFVGYSWEPGLVAVYSQTKPEAGKWYHVVVQWNGTHQCIYVNGIKENCVEQPTYDGSGVDNWLFVAFSPGSCSGNQGYFKGQIAEVRVYNRSLTDAEIQTLYEKSPGANIVTNGLVLWHVYSKKTLHDFSGNGNDGTAYGNPKWVVDSPYSGWVDGKWGKALRFDGVDDYVEIPYSPELFPDYITITAWVYKEPGGDSGKIIKTDSWTYMIGVWYGKPWIELWNESGARISSWVLPVYLEDNKWYFIAVAYDGRYVYAYVYNETGLVYSGTYDPLQYGYAIGPLKKPVSNIKIGAYNPGVAVWKGYIDEVRIYNRALSPEEIKALYEKNKHKYLTKVYVGGQLVNETYVYNTKILGDFEGSLDNWGIDCGGSPQYTFVQGVHGKAIKIYPTGGDYLACIHQIEPISVTAGQEFYFYAKGQNIWAQVWCGYTNSKLYMYNNGQWKLVGLHSSNKWHLYKLVVQKNEAKKCRIYLYAKGQGSYGIFDFVTDENPTAINLEILKEGSHNITVEAISLANATLKDTKSVIFSLDLYDEAVTYSNYTTYNSNKYVDTLSYELKVRCGALGHNITVLANFTDANKTYTIVCDNQTHMIQDNFRFLTEGNKTVWFYLNAVNESDSRYFRNNSFIADLYPPVIEYLNYTLTEGFRDNLTETAFYKVVDTISPVVYCSYTYNTINGTDSIQNYTAPITHQFNLTPKNKLELVCRDILNHTAKDTKTFEVVLHELHYKDDILDTEGTPSGNTSLIAYIGSKQFSILNHLPRYLVAIGVPPVEYYFQEEDDNKVVVTYGGLVTNKYMRYYYILDPSTNVTIYYTTADRLYEILFVNRYSEPVIGSLNLNGRDITQVYVGASQTGSMFAPADLVYRICASTTDLTRRVCYETKYLSSPYQTEFYSFPSIVYISKVTFTYEKVGENSYKVWMVLPDADDVTIKVYRDSDLIDQVTGRMFYWEAVYNLTEPGVYKFELHTTRYGDKFFTIYLPKGLPTITILTGWERELLAFVFGIFMLGIVSLAGLGIGLITAGAVMIAMAWLLQAPYGVTMSFGIALALVGIIYLLIRSTTS